MTALGELGLRLDGITKALRGMMRTVQDSFINAINTIIVESGSVITYLCKCFD